MASVRVGLKACPDHEEARALIMPTVRPPPPSPSGLCMTLSLCPPSPSAPAVLIFQSPRRPGAHRKQHNAPRLPVRTIIVIIIII